MINIADAGRIFEKYTDSDGTHFGWLPATVVRVHANGYLTVNTSAGTYYVDEKEFVV